MRDHASTLIDDRDQRRSSVDVFVFYVVPLIFGAFYYWHPFELPDSVKPALIAVFSVFGALLFSAQVALYTLSLTPRRPANDSILQSLEDARYFREKKYFRDINYNVSYLILLSCLFLLLFVVLMVVSLPAPMEGAVLVFSVSHFFLTLLMLIKRTHIAFAIRHNDLA